MKKFYLVFTAIIFLISKVLTAQIQSITFTSPTMNQVISGGENPEEIPFTVTYNSQKDNYYPSSERVEYIELITHVGIFYDDIGHGIPEGEDEIPGEFNLEPGYYHWYLKQYEKYTIGGIIPTCSTEVYFYVKHTLTIETNLGGKVKVDFHIEDSGIEKKKLINQSLYLEGLDQEISGNYYTWAPIGSTESRWTIKKLGEAESFLSNYRNYTYHVASDDNNSALKGYLIYDETPPSAPQNLTVGSANNYPVLSWTANSEPDLKNYQIYRQIDNGSMTYLATTTNNSYTDNSIVIVPMNRFYYKVKAIDLNDNNSEFSNQVSILGMLLKYNENNEKYEMAKSSEITDYILKQNYPNPFNPLTSISYQIPSDGSVSLKIFNSVGQEIKTLVNRFQAQGIYTVQFDASELPSGVYIYKLQSGNFSSTKKMLLTK